MTSARRRLACAGGAAVMAVLVGASPARAASGAGAPAIRTVGNFPNGYIEYTLPSSGHTSDSLRVGDDGDATASFDLVAVDGFTSDLSSVVYGDGTHPLRDGPGGNGEYGAGTWITLATSRLTLKPGEQTTVGYTVRVPAGMHAGDYVGGISAENRVPTGAPSSSQGVGLSITQRSVIAVVVHVPGVLRVPSFAVGRPTLSVENQRRQVITFPLTYGGDTLVKPHLTFTITGADGRQLLRFDRKLDTFVPHTTIQFPFPIDGTTLVPGTYRVAGSFGDGTHDARFDNPLTVTTATANVPPAGQRSGPPPRTHDVARTPAWVVPAAGAAAALVVLALLSAAALWWRRPCSHCGARALRGHLLIRDFHEIAACVPCRARALRRDSVRLCPRCFRSHVLAQAAASAGGAARLSA